MTCQTQINKWTAFFRLGGETYLISLNSDKLFSDFIFLYHMYSIQFNGNFRYMILLFNTLTVNSNCRKTRRHSACFP